MACTTNPIPQTTQGVGEVYRMRPERVGQAPFSGILTRLVLSSAVILLLPGDATPGPDQAKTSPSVAAVDATQDHRSTPSDGLSSLITQIDSSSTTFGSDRIEAEHQVRRTAGRVARDWATGIIATTTRATSSFEMSHNHDQEIRVVDPVRSPAQEYLVSQFSTNTPQSETTASWIRYEHPHLGEVSLYALASSERDTVAATDPSRSDMQLVSLSFLSVTPDGTLDVVTVSLKGHSALSSSGDHAETRTIENGELFLSYGKTDVTDPATIAPYLADAEAILATTLLSVERSQSPEPSTDPASTSVSLLWDVAAGL